MTAVSGLTCGYPEHPPIFISKSIISAPNQWQDSIRVGRTMSSCRLEKVSGEAEILNQRESTALVAGTGLGMSTGWFLTSTSSHILAASIVVGRVNVAGDQGRPPHAGGMVEIGEGARILTAKGAGAKVGWHVTLW